MEVVTGKLSREFLHFLVGYSTVVAAIALAISAKTTVYGGIVAALREAPLPSAILGAPLVFGLVFSSTRFAFQFKCSCFGRVHTSYPF